MPDIAQEIAQIDDKDLLDLHDRLDESGPYDAADVQAHHLITTEILRRGGSHGHEGDEWGKAVILVDSVTVESAADMSAPAGMEKAWDDALAGGGTVSVMLTVDGYVMKADPTSSDVHVDAVMGKPKRRKDKPILVDESDPVEKRDIPDVIADLEQNIEHRQEAIDDYLYGPMNPEEPGDYWERLAEVWDVSAEEAATTRCGNCSAFNVTTEIRTAMADAIGEGGDQVVESADLGYCELLDFKCAATRCCSAWLVGGPIDDEVAKHGSGDQSPHGNWAAGRAGSAQAGWVGPGDGSLNLKPEVKQRIRETLGNGQIAANYGDGYAEGKADAKGEDIYGEKKRWSPTQTGKRLNAEKKKRDKAADQLMNAPRGQMLAENLSANVLASQGFIDGATSAKPQFRRGMSTSETLGSLLAAVPSGAFKAVEGEDLFKHGTGDQSAHGNWAKGGGAFADMSPELAAVAKKFANGGTVTVDAKDVPAIIDAMGDMKKNVDLTNLHIRGNDIFDEGNLGIPRVDMPQIPKAKAPKFIEEMGDAGVSVTEKSVDPLTLRPTQHEMNAVEVSGIAEAMRTGNFHSTNKLFVSNDGHILDGHHRWAAGVVESIRLGGKPLAVAVVDLPIRELLKVAEEFHLREGIDRRTMSDVTKALIDRLVREYDETVLEPAFKHGSGDQSPHGNWAKGGAGSASSGGGAGATAGASGGGGGNGKYSATYDQDVQQAIDSKPDEIRFHYNPDDPTKSETLKKGSQSAWHHVVPNPEAPGGYSLTPERQALWDNEVALHLDGVPTGREAPVFVMMGGGGGSGKGTLLESGDLDGAIPDGGMKGGEHVYIDVDKIKMHFPEYNKMVQDEKKAEVASYVHEESSMIGKLVQARAVGQKSHVVLDGTGDAGIDSLRRKLAEPRKTGYRIIGEYVTAPVRTQDRSKAGAGAWERNILRAKVSARGLVPAKSLLEAHQSVSTIVPDVAGDFDEFRLHDTGFGRGGKVIATASLGGKIQVKDQQMYDEFLAKAKDPLTAAQMEADITEEDIREINAAKG